MKKNKCIGQVSIVLFLLTLVVASCTTATNEETSSVLETDYFEGEIKLIEYINYAGLALNTHFVISENKIKREQKFLHLPGLLNTTVGMIADLEQDSVVLFYKNYIDQKKCTISIAEYLDFVKDQKFKYVVPSVVDPTFTEFTTYETIKEVKDSTTMRGFSVDYSRHRFADEENVAIGMEQEIFDTKAIVIKRKLLTLIFPRIPESINFPLESSLELMIDEIENDSLIQSDLVKGLDTLIWQPLQEKDTLNEGKETDVAANLEADLEALSNSKLLNFGLDVVKKGLNIASNRNTKVVKVTPKKVVPTTIDLPKGDFEPVIGLTAFFAIVLAASGDFDD